MKRRQEQFDDRKVSLSHYGIFLPTTSTKAGGGGGVTINQERQVKQNVGPKHIIRRELKFRSDFKVVFNDLLTGFLGPFQEIRNPIFFVRKSEGFVFLVLTE